MAKIPFSIEHRDKIESGEYRVETKAGCPVRIVCWDMACKLPILGLVLLNDKKAEEIAVGFTNEGTNLLGDPLYDKLFIVTPEEEWSEFESCLLNALEDAIDTEKLISFTKEKAKELLALAREQFIKEGYVIEKKAFHDAVEKISVSEELYEHFRNAYACLEDANCSEEELSSKWKKNRYDQARYNLEEAMKIISAEQKKE